MLHRNQRHVASYQKRPFWFMRKLEQPLFWHCPCIAEFYNTLSNLPFIAIGLLRLYSEDVLWEYPTEPWMRLYWLMVAAGVCSAVHHATVPYWTIVVDWLPILASGGYCVWLGVLPLISYGTWFKMGLAFVIMVDDQLITRIPVPFGHVFWHITAAYAVDSMYQDYIHRNC
jgi:hypothetical protein